MGEMQIKTMLRNHFTLTMMANIRNQDNFKITVGKNVEKLESSYVAGGNVKRCGCFGKVWQFLKKSNELPCGPTIPLLGMDPRELTAGIQTGICTPVCIAS